MSAKDVKACLPRGKYVVVSAPPSDDEDSKDKVAAAVVPSTAPAPRPLRAPSRVAAVMRGLSTKNMKIIVPFSFSLSCGAGGIVNSSIAINVDSNSTEWNALIALYDEYRVEGGKIEYTLGYSTPVIIPGTNTLTSDYAHVLSYDPVDITALTGVRNGCEQAYHKLTMPTWMTIGTVAAPGIAGTFRGTNKLVFRADLKALPVTAGGALGNMPPGQWLECNAAGNNQACGFIKSYGTSFHAASVSCVSGIAYLRLAFRARK